MARIKGFDHVGITVADLDSATAFFVGLGLEVVDRTFVEGEFLDTVCGIADSRTEIVMLRPPAGGTGLELASFVRPDHLPDHPTRWRTNSVYATSASRSPTFKRRSPASWQMATDCRRHWPAREQLAHGIRPRTRGHPRLAR
jgi:catechol 2,3-dioxygenase-like lactoylglutathione lyase family enzyme